MSDTITGIVGKTLIYYRKSLLFQILIIALLSSVITGSLLTGWSVRASLKKSSVERLGNTGILLSSGVRYFEPDLGRRIYETDGIRSAGILEMKGYCQNLNSQKGAYNTNIYAIDSSFFQFNGYDSVNPKPGEVCINNRLAEYLDVRPGDELIIRFKKVSDIPSDAPFAPGQDEKTSVVMKIGAVLNPNQGGNFSLSISQIVPMNLFMNLSDLNSDTTSKNRINRLLIDKKSDFSVDKFKSLVKKNLNISDIGLKLREVSKTGSMELISDRVFIEKQLIEEVGKLKLHSAPLLTYLGNRFISNSGSTPYSFITALPESIYSEVFSGDSIVINRWMSEDLKAGIGD
jgi:putative ABC transport system permease protein